MRQIFLFLAAIFAEWFMIISSLRGGKHMLSIWRIFERGSRNSMWVALFGPAVAVALVLPAAIADSSGDAKRVALETVDRNADQIAIVGDVLYYFGEPGMQEYESSKYLKQTLEDIGFKVELGGAGMPTNVWATWGSGKPYIVIATDFDALP